jgi:hypothetical protein
MMVWETASTAIPWFRLTTIRSFAVAARAGRERRLMENACVGMDESTLSFANDALRPSSYTYSLQKVYSISMNVCFIGGHSLVVIL